MTEERSGKKWILRGARLDRDQAAEWEVDRGQYDPPPPEEPKRQQVRYQRPNKPRF